VHAIEEMGQAGRPVTESGIDDLGSFHAAPGRGLCNLERHRFPSGMPAVPRSGEQGRGDSRISVAPGQTVSPGGPAFDDGIGEAPALSVLLLREEPVDGAIEDVPLSLGHDAGSGTHGQDRDDRRDTV